ncbi:hypothetical protein [uncultured Endozoicomonas sp.]|uniref:hypothetical protein n=1 Tax=uncultured Endozoicomonas sp. TaxID=432652 RepID=UPI002611410F|nr:hypothetical protein [uncultured Endozoicomonas sp.]
MPEILTTELAIFNGLSEAMTFRQFAELVKQAAWGLWDVILQALLLLTNDEVNPKKKPRQ